ncbi:MAG: multiheme c-type cytochrome [Chthoniobacterales bacterium]
MRAAEPLQVRTDGARFVGSTGCKSSSCHGGAGEKRSQFLTWSQKDFHTRGFAILTNARSQRMAEAIDVTSAETSSRCTSCHSPLQAIAPARLTSGVDPHEGVSCENCHGAAETWLRGHTRKDWSYAARVGAGMRDLRSFYVRANTCVACHQNLESDLLDAGHPLLLFELDGQSIAEPKHWQDPAESGVRAWLVGQAVALREVSWHLTGSGGADLRIVAQWDALAWLLSEVTAIDSTLPRIETSDYSSTQSQADAVARRASQQNFGSEFANRVSDRLTAVRASDISLQRAQRLVLALECLSLGSPRSELRALRDELSDFNSARFAEKLAAFASTRQR